MKSEGNSPQRREDAEEKLSFSVSRRLRGSPSLTSPLAANP